MDTVLANEKVGTCGKAKSRGQHIRAHATEKMFHQNKNLILKMPSKLIRILRITFCYKQQCGRCLVHMTPVVKVVIHCVFALL